MLALYVYPAQVVFCRQALASLADLAAWGALLPDLNALLRSEPQKLEAAIWVESARETPSNACGGARQGRLVEVPLSAQDEQRRQRIFTSTVLPRWLAAWPLRWAQKC